MVSPDGPRAPRLVVFDVNETLSDMSAMTQRFTEVGVSGAVAATWFASLLRDGFALTAAGVNPSFTDLGAETLRSGLSGQVADLDAAMEHIMSAFTGLPVHPDVVEGIQSLHALGLRLVTLSNGPASVAQGLLERNGLTDHFERVLSVQEAPLWKPAREAYSFALQVCEVEPSEAMLVAVHPWDIHGARQAGLGTGWINRTKARYPSYFAPPDLEATSLIDLAIRVGYVGADPAL